MVQRQLFHRFKLCPSGISWTRRSLTYRHTRWQILLSLPEYTWQLLKQESWISTNQWPNHTAVVSNASVQSNLKNLLSLKRLSLYNTHLENQLTSKTTLFTFRVEQQFARLHQITDSVKFGKNIDYQTCRSRRFCFFFCLMWNHHASKSARRKGRKFNNIVIMHVSIYLRCRTANATFCW